MRGYRAVPEGVTLGMFHGEHGVSHARAFGGFGPLATIEFERMEEVGILMAVGPIFVGERSEIEMKEQAETPGQEVLLKRAGLPVDSTEVVGCHGWSIGRLRLRVDQEQAEGQKRQESKPESVSGVSGFHGGDEAAAGYSFFGDWRQKNM